MQKKAVETKQELIGRHLTILAQEKNHPELICALIHAVKAYHQNIVDPQHLLKGLGHEMG
jgi:hypothetical protein